MRVKSKIGVYTLVNENSGLIYVGSGSLADREYDHYYHLKKGTHVNKKLQQAYNEDPNFIFNSVVTGDREEAFDIEQKFLSDHFGSEFLLNINGNARYGRGSGWVMSEETKKKLSEANTGKTASEETKEKLSKARMGNTFSLGYKHTEETKANMSLAKIGHSVSDDTKDKIRSSNLGQIRSAETIERIRLSRIGTTASEETKVRMREAKLGIPHDDDRKAKIGEGNRGKVRTDEDKAHLLKPVSINNIVYPSIKDAASALGINRSTVENKLKDDRFPEWGRVPSTSTLSN